LTVVAGIGIALSSSVLSRWGIAGDSVAQLAYGVGCCAALGYASGKTLARPAPKANTYRRGALVGRYVPAAAKSRARAAEITLAGLAIPAQDETKHFKLIGTTGTGKSTAIREIMTQALARGDRAVIADPDGGYLRHFHRPERGDVLLNPFDRRSVKWNLFAEINSSYDVEQLARSLIPDHDGQDRSWRGYARTFFTAVTRQAHEAGITDVNELYRLLVVADTDELRALVRGTPAQPFLDEHNSRMFDSIRSVTSSAVGALEYVGRQEGTEFSIRGWVRDKNPGVLFIPYKAGQIAALRSTISAWMRLAIFEAMEQEEGPRGSSRNGRLWFVIDELDALGQIDGLKDALARLRKFDGRCVLGFQSLAQVSSTYGQGDAHTIVENCGNTLILRCSASEGGGTARFASQLIGEREILRTTVSKSRRATEFLGSVTHAQHLNVEAAVLPSQVEQLPDLAGYLKYASDPTWQRVRLDAKYAWEQRARDAAPNDLSHDGAERD
jgi:type IV secretory pathway TraG/TraD family ATPase VirD4